MSLIDLSTSSFLSNIELALMASSCDHQATLLLPTSLISLYIVEVTHLFHITSVMTTDVVSWWISLFFCDYPVNYVQSDNLGSGYIINKIITLYWGFFKVTFLEKTSCFKRNYHERWSRCFLYFKMSSLFPD